MRLPIAFQLVASAAMVAFAAPAAAQSLDVVIAEAMARSPSLEGARARAESARAGVSAARAERAPSAALEGQIGVGRIDPQGFFGLTADDVVPRSARATVELPLFTGGRINAAIRQATGGAEAADQQVRMAALELRVRVVQAYVQAVAARQLIARYDTLNRALDEALRQARLKFKAGEGTSTETAQAEARRAEAEAGLSGARGQLAGAMAQLAVLAGHPVTLDVELPGAPQIPASSDAAIAMALKDNPMVLVAIRQIDAARAKSDGVRAERLPTIGAYAEAASVRDQFFPGYKADSASVGLRARWTIFSGGRIGAKASGAAADLRAAQADADNARLVVEQQAVVAFQDVTTARAVLSASEARLTASEAALRGTALEVKAGAKPQLAQLDAEREAIEAQAARAEAGGRVLVATYRLRAIAGMD
ncbi:TolC family protein [Sphingomonas sp. BE137]|jgi:outer membrane protein|uniref:TolC family protein n=1 Tax=Sphingomonas sp. BE137 TaxID=2817844 RepID=UPI001AE2CBE2|nr:TolC family protein [Sphingomonas sp. BE137]MDR6850298.1 outer membrane protein [Sphingomonas sp. BE137]